MARECQPHPFEAEGRNLIDSQLQANTNTEEEGIIGTCLKVDEMVR